MKRLQRKRIQARQTRLTRLTYWRDNPSARLLANMGRAVDRAISVSRAEANRKWAKEAASK